MIKKTLALIEADIKTFMRNWKSIVIMIFFPLILISLIFLSFSSEGLIKIPVGVVLSTSELEKSYVQDNLNIFFITHFYDDYDSCIENLKTYKEYACIVVRKEEAFILEVYYDNTRDPVIWEVVSRIKRIVEIMQKQRSKSMAYGLMEQLDENIGKIDEYKIMIINMKSNVDDFITNLKKEKSRLKSRKKSVISNINSALNFISTIDSALYDIQNYADNINQLSYNLESIIDLADTSNFYNLSPSEANVIYNIRNYAEDLDDDFDFYVSRILSKQEDAHQSLLNIRSSLNSAKLYTNKFNYIASNLDDVISDLQSYKSGFDDVIDNIDKIKERLDVIKTLDPEILINPIVMRAYPSYVPKYKAGEDLQKIQNITEEQQKTKVARGFNLIGLQIIYPKILLLLLLFLSLLLSSFITLTNINSSTSKRLRIIKGLKIPHFISLYIASFITLLVPIIVAVLVGNFLFKLPLLENYKLLFLLMFAISSIFIFFGISLSYIIKKESITLLINTFLLVSLIFFSGFILPVERMSTYASLFAQNFPGYVGLNILNKVIFYNVGLDNIYKELLIIFIWFVAALFLALASKSLENILSRD